MYTKDTLKNGIRVVTEYIPYVNSVSIGIWIANGSRNENSKNNGISHFIEHMMFKGTYNRTSREIAESIEEIGGQINAFTGKESTCYYARVLDSHINTAIDVLSDMLINSKLSPDDIEKEKSVINEEISMYEDSPEDLVTDLLSTAIWPEASIGFPVLGTHKTLESMDHDALIDYIKNHYTSGNIVVSIVGNFKHDKLLSVLEERLGSWNIGNTRTDYDIPEINKAANTKFKDIEQVHISLGLKGIEAGNDDLYTLLAVNNIFGGGTSSRLFQKIREEKGLAYSIFSYPSSYKNIGIFSIYAGLNQKYVLDAINTINEEIENIRTCNITEEQLYKSKEQLKGNMLLGLESTSNRMFGIGKSELLMNRINEPSEVLKKIDNISMDDVCRIIQNVFGPGIISAAAVGNIDKNNNFNDYLV